MPDQDVLHSSTKKPIRAWPWVLLAMVGLGVGGYYVADGPNRLKAAGLAKEAQLALLSSDFKTALTQYRLALTARPTDFELHRQYTEVQRSWVRTLFQQVEGKGHRDAHLHLRGIEAEWIPLLTEPQLGEVRQRAGAHRAAFAQELQASVEAAMKKAEEGLHEEALGLLQGLQPHAELIPELSQHIRAVQVARVRKVMAQAEEYVGAGMYKDAAHVLTAVIEDAEGVSGYTQLVEKNRRLDLENTVATARDAAKTGDYAEAETALKEAAELGAAPGEVEALRQEIVFAARQNASLGLVRAMIRDDVDAVRLNLDHLHRHAGLQASGVVPEDLVGTLRFSAVMDALGKLGILGGQATTEYRLDAHLVYLLADRFEDRAPARALLAEALGTWSTAQAAAGRPGVAAELLRLAQTYGLAVDADKMASLDEAMQAPYRDLEIVIRPPAASQKHHIDGELVALALSKGLNQQAKGWPLFRLSSDKPRVETQPLELELRCELALDHDDSPSATTRSAQYQSGTRRLVNEQRQRLFAESRALESRARQVRYEIQDLNARSQAASQDPYLSYEQRVSEVTAAELGAVAKTIEAGRLERESAEAESQARSLPEELLEPVYSTEDYKVITHRHTYTADWTVQAFLGQTPFDGLWHSTQDATRQTEEIVGNHRRGVPVKKESPVDLKAVGRELMLDLSNDPLATKVWPHLPHIIADLVAIRADAEKRPNLDSAEILFGLRAAWKQRAGVEIDTENAERVVLIAFLPPFDDKDA
jgi:tetratricopeptide (TPR) repeat protein